MTFELSWIHVLCLQTSLKFDSQIKISDSAKDLIQNLCTGKEERFGYEGLGCHSFFNGVEWTKLQDSKCFVAIFHLSRRKRVGHPWCYGKDHIA